VSVAQADRQLLAIMFTDVVGYTAITERDEAAAERIRAAHRELVQTRVRQFDGEVVDVTGDESLSIFVSALRAVDCALAIQGALRSDPEFRLRIGIHLGDVLRQEGEVIGEGVNVAARIRPLAEPGGICISEPIYQLVRTRVRSGAEPLGPKALKNVEQPLALYALRADDAAAPRAFGRRRGLWIAAAALVLLLGAGWLFRAPLVLWGVTTLSQLRGGSVQQEIGFAETKDGVRIAYATSGRGPPLVFVLGWHTHLIEGLGSPLYDQAGMLAFHSRSNTVVRFDGRGFGLSDRDVDDFSLDARVADVEAVVDALGLERFALYAYSAGGPAGVAYAARHPERVSKLVLAATTAKPEAAPGREEEIQAMIEFMRTSSSRMARAAFIEFLAPEATAVDRRLMMHFFEVSGDPIQSVAFMQAMRPMDVSAAARTLRMPTLVLASDIDEAMAPEQTRRLASLIPGARFEVVEGASHRGASASDPRVMELVAGFLGE
jgi:class 3 adenylate cyclase/pimeloyl-ACP methyl ester carboxylesterase